MKFLNFITVLLLLPKGFSKPLLITCVLTEVMPLSLLLMQSSLVKAQNRALRNVDHGETPFKEKSLGIANDENTEVLFDLTRIETASKPSNNSDTSFNLKDGDGHTDQETAFLRAIKSKNAKALETNLSIEPLGTVEDRDIILDLKQMFDKTEQSYESGKPHAQQCTEQEQTETCVKIGRSCTADNDCCSMFCDTYSNGNKMCSGCRSNNDCETGEECSNKIENTLHECVGDGKRELSGVQIITKGYNVFKAAPTHKGYSNDNGFVKGPSRVFKLEYPQGGNQVSFTNEVYDVPSKYRSLYRVSGRLHTTSTMITTSTQFTSEVSTYIKRLVGADAPYRGFNVGIKRGIAAEANAKFMRDSSEGKTTSITEASNTLYEISMSKLSSGDLDPPSLDETLKCYLNQYPEDSTSEKEWFHRLFDDYGTHVITRAIFGSSFGMITVLTETQRETVIGAGGSLQTSLSASLECVFKSCRAASESETGGSVGFTVSQKLATFHNSVETFTTGSSAFSSIEAFENDDSEKDVMEMDLTPICDIIPSTSPQNFKNTCAGYFVTYCQKLMMDKRLCTDENECSKLCTEDGDIQCIVNEDCEGNREGKFTCKKNKCSHECVKDMDCNHGKICYNKKCNEKQRDGAACNRHADCISGNCQILRGCVTKKQNGQFCNEHADCMSGRCSLEGPFSSLKCRAKKGRGGYCNENADCNSGHCRAYWSSWQCT